MSLTFDQILTEQRATARYVANFVENSKKSIKQSNVTVGYLNRRLALLEDYWNAYHNNNRRLMLYKEYAESDYFLSEEYNITEEQYLVAASYIEVEIEARTPKATQPTAAPAQIRALQQIQLPQIDLPAFDGDPLKWESFRDLFTSMIKDAPGLTGSQKFLYLQSKLTGEAAELVKNTNVTDLAFSGAWEDLEARYGNPRIISSFHMKGLFSIPEAEKSSPSEIRRLIDSFRQSIRAFQALKKPISQWDEFFVYLLVQKLDRGTRMVWETSLSNSKEIPTFQSLVDFLENRVHALEFAGSVDHGPRIKTSSHPTKMMSPPHRIGRAALSTTKSPDSRALKDHDQGTTTKSKNTCPLCSGPHKLNYCQEFKGLSPLDRQEQASKLKACTNCLRQGHSVKDCPSTSRCLACNKAHHSLLHVDSYKPSRAPVSRSTSGSQTRGEQIQPSGEPRTIHTLTSIAEQTVLIATARVRIEDRFGNSIVLRAVLDTAADASLITEAAARSLNLTGSSVRIPISGVNCTPAGSSNREVEFELKSLRDKTFSMRLGALTVPKITNLVPQVPIVVKKWPHLEGLPLADPDFAMPGEVDLLLSAQVTGHLLLDESRKGSLDEPVVRSTPFGWIITGPAGYSSARLQSRPISANLVQAERFFSIENFWEDAPIPTKTVCHCTVQPNVPYDHDCVSCDLQRFWEQEELLETPLFSEEDARVRKFFADTYTRDQTGRFVVRLPFRLDPRAHLSLNKSSATALLIAQERRFSRDPKLHSEYSKFMEEYANLGHMSPSIIPNSGFFLPHHGVWKADPLPKLRVVFNASHVSSSGKSLNDCLAPGPKLQSELWTVVTRARLFKVFFTADIVKMFRQILVHPDDQIWQQILWRFDVTALLSAFLLLTVTYGLNCAPYLALEVLLQLAKTGKPRYPLAAKVIEDTSYMDDFHAGGDDLDSALEVRDQLIALLESGGFCLSKWASNCPDLCECSINELKILNESESVSILGLAWNPKDDTFSLKISVDRLSNGEPTKRSILSDIARMFDPLGWFGPCLIPAKVIIQNVWLLGLDWDEPIPTNLLEQWTNFRSALPYLESIKIPRWLGTLSSDTKSLELHAFCDASERAYAAAVYLKINNESRPACNLVMAKTKVAPVKTVSIPRLELCGALLASRLVIRLRNDLHIPNTPIFAYTDSQVALAWIKAHASKWPTYVANRVSKIQTLVHPHDWRHVRSSDNPADLATRGITPSELQISNLWWNGPSFLSTNHRSDDENYSERVVFLTTKAESSDHGNLLYRYSNLYTLIRTTAYCLRFLTYKRPENLKTPILGPLHPVSKEEYNQALRKWISISQRHHFAEELSLLEKGKTLLKRHRIRPLHPFLDEHGLLRVGGRLQNACLSFEEKHPVILPKDSFLSTLVVREAHLRTLHGGPQLMISHVVRKFWIPHIHPLAKSILDECVVCSRYAAKTLTQIMGNLPKHRLSSIRPFIASGVDYAGPIMLRTSKGRGHKAYKGYICVFVCMATKAMHLEAVSDLTSKAFIAAFSRFVSRRGHCQSLWSDNGKTFVGADSELKAMFHQASQFYKECCVSLAKDEVDWTFIPPLSPHEGGLWEAGVKSVKHHLKRVIGTSTLTFEEISTLLCQIEACLNSRPLAMLSKSPLDLTPLTPGHFLVGHPLSTLPEPGFVDFDMSPSSRYRLISRMRDDFWRRWKSEYLSTLQPRACWHEIKDQLRVNSIVLLKEENTPPSKWPLAQVTKVKVSPDGQVRHVMVRTATGEYKRHIVKLCLLPVVVE